MLGRVTSSAAPTSGIWHAGQLVWAVPDNSSSAKLLPSATTTVGWICVTGGKPGVWQAFHTDPGTLETKRDTRQHGNVPLSHPRTKTDDESQPSAAIARQYRRRVTPRVSSSYGGHRHLLVLLLASSVGVVVPLVCLRGDYRCTLPPLCLCLVPLGLLYGNIVEYALHRWGGHEVRWRAAPLRAFRHYHAKVHHTFFAGSGEEWKVDNAQDLYFVLFPAWIYVLWIGLGLAPLLLGGLLGGALAQPDAEAVLGGARGAGGLAPNDGGGAGWPVLTDSALLLSSCGAFTLMQYELLHAYSHRALPLWLQQRLEKTGLFDGVMSRHRRHHRQNDGTNYNITWPVGDWLFGTLAAT
jgi:hypothetical protein